MTKREFSERITDMEDTMYRVSYSVLKNPHDQADAIQETILKAWWKLDSLREDQYFQTWVIRILMNVCRDMARKKHRECPSEHIEVEAPPTADGAMMEALSELDEKYRLTIVLHHVEGYTTKEVARIMRVPEGTVKFRLARGRKLLKEILTEENSHHEYAQ